MKELMTKTVNGKGRKYQVCACAGRPAVPNYSSAICRMPKENCPRSRLLVM